MRKFEGTMRYQIALGRCPRLVFCFTSWLFLAMGASDGQAQDPPQTPSALAQLEEANKRAVARYGAAVTPPAGEISDAGKLAHLALSLQPDAYASLADEIVRLSPVDVKTTIALITTTGDLGMRITSAREIETLLDNLICEGKKFAKEIEPKEEICEDEAGAGLTLPSILAVAGAIDSLVGLFRTNYAVASSDVAANKLALQIALSNRWPGQARIDGFELYPEAAVKFSRLLATLGRLRSLVASSSPAEKSPQAAFVAAATAALASLRASGADGIAPAGRIATLLYQTEGLGVVLYVDVVASTGTVLTTKRLFRRNNKVHVYLTGLVNAVYQVVDGRMVALPALRIGEAATLELHQLERKSNRSLMISTGAWSPPPKESDADQEAEECPCEHEPPP